MKASHKIIATKKHLVPQGEARIAWLEKHGLVTDATAAEIILTADSKLWMKAGANIDTDATAAWQYMSRATTDSVTAMMPPELLVGIVAKLKRSVADTGDLPQQIEADAIIEDYIKTEAEKAAQRREKEQKEAAARAKAEAEKAAKAEAEKAAKAAAKARREAWISAHGSERLRRCVAEGIECLAAYRDERLAAKRPGWEWDTCGTDELPRNPPAEAFALLDEARKTAPDAKLSYMILDAITDEETGEETVEEWRGYVAKAEFIGRDIVYGRPRDEG